MSPLLVLGLRRASVSGVIYVRPQAPRTGRQCRQATTGAREEPQAAAPDDRRQQPPRLLGTAARARVAHNRQSKPASTRISVSAALMPRQKRPRTCPADPPVQVLLIVCLKQREGGREREGERERECVCVCVFGDCVRVRDLPSRARHSQSCPYPSRACCDASCGCFWDQRNAKNAAPSGHDGLAGRCMERTRGQQSGRNVDIITIFIPVFTGAYEREVLIMRRLVTHALNLHCCSRPFDCIVGLLLAATAQPESTPHPGGHATRLARRANQCGGRRDCA